jgi:VanZ family protein
MVSAEQDSGKRQVTKRKAGTAIKFWLPVLLCMGFIFYTSSIPGVNIPSLFAYQDVIFHFFIYSLLAYFFSRALKNTYSYIEVTKIIFFTVLFGIIYGLSDEFHQSFVAYREDSVIDVLIDSIATFVGSLLFTRFQKT